MGHLVRPWPIWGAQRRCSFGRLEGGRGRGVRGRKPCNSFLSLLEQDHSLCAPIRVCSPTFGPRWGWRQWDPASPISGVSPLVGTGSQPGSLSPLELEEPLLSLALAVTCLPRDWGCLWRTSRPCFLALCFISLCCYCSFAKSCPTPRTAACQASLSFTTSWSLLKLMSIESVILSNHLILCHPLLLPSVFPSIRVFSSDSALGRRWSKYWSFSFSIRPYNEYSGLISFRIDWFDLLAVQGTLKSLL